MTAPDPRLGEIEARLAAITPGDWKYHTGTYVVEVLPEFDLHRFDQMSTEIFKVLESDGDGVFAANSPADVAYLLAELRKRDEELARVDSNVRVLARRLLDAELSDAFDVLDALVEGEISLSRAAVSAATGGGA